MTKKIMELSIAGFFIVLSYSLIQTRNYLEIAVIEYQELISSQIQIQNELIVATKDAQIVAREVGFALSARFLEAQGLFLPTDANKIVGDALEKINQNSSRLAMFGKAINDAYLTEASEMR